MSDQTPYSSYPDSPQWQNPPSGGYPPSSGSYTPPPYGQPQPSGYGAPGAGYPQQQSYPPPQYPQQGYPPNPQPVYMTAPVSEPGSGMAVASLVLGILGIVLFWLWFLGIPLSVIGVIMGALGRRSISRRGIATAGLVCSIIGLVAALIIVLLALIAAASIHSYY